MVGHAQRPGILAETQFCALLVDQTVDVSRRQLHMVAYVAVLQIKQMGILVAYGEGAGRRGGYDIAPVTLDCRTDRLHIRASLTLGLRVEAVRYESHAAALLLIQKPHAVTQRIHYTDHILAQLRVIVIDVAAVEIRDLTLERRLLLRRVTTVPRLERPVRILREDTAVVDTHHLVHDHTHGLGRHGRIHHRRQRRGKRTHEIGVGEDVVADRGVVFGAVLDTRRLYDVAYAHVRRAGNLTPLAVETVLQRAVEEVGLLQTQALAVGAGLLGARIVGIHRRYGTIDRTDGALDALFEIVFADCILLNVHDHLPFRILSATY